VTQHARFILELRFFALGVASITVPVGVYMLVDDWNEARLERRRRWGRGR
jgi:hypothetical protein